MTASSKPLFALVDCNSYYCSCERLFRPDLKHRPVGVLSNNDGCFISRTNELKKLGVKMGEPYFKVAKLCHKNNVAIFSANFPLYTNLSKRVMETLATFTPKIEVYSIDEAFLDLSHLAKLKLGELQKYALKIKQTIEKNIGIPVSIGISYSKTLAKLANYWAKRSEKSQGVVTLIKQPHLDYALKKTSIDDVWGVGRSYAKQMKTLGIYTAWDLKSYQNSLYIRKLFTKVGLQIKEELAGHSCFSILTGNEKKRGISHSRTFGQELNKLESLQESIAQFISYASEKMRKQKSTCSHLSLGLRTSPFKNTTQHRAHLQIPLASSTQDTRKLICHGIKGLSSIYKPGYLYKKSGIYLSGFNNQNESQLSLFESQNNDDEKSYYLMKIMDQINQKYGPLTLKSAACGGPSPIWRMHQKFKSPSYLTGYTQLPKAN